MMGVDKPRGLGPAALQCIAVWAEFWNSERGQDLVEYSLLMAFVTLTGAAMFVSMGKITGNLWGIVNNRLAAANQSS